MELLGQLVQVRDLILDPVELGRGVPLIACLALALSQVTLDQGQCRQCSFQADRQVEVRTSTLSYVQISVSCRITTSQHDDTRPRQDKTRQDKLRRRGRANCLQKRLIRGNVTLGY